MGSFNQYGILQYYHAPVMLCSESIKAIVEKNIHDGKVMDE
jgi:hypothetical protein